MLNDSQTSAGINDVNEVVQFMLEISRSMISTSRTAATGSEPHNLTAAFEEAISGLSLTQEQLIELWALFMLGAQVARKAHRDLVGNTN